MGLPGAGIIPALAGNTRHVGGGRLVESDHPRSRGEYDVASAQLAVPLGIIPALAGNTLHCALTRGFVWDHPRSRGEYMEDLLNPTIVAGSSPLSRGIPLNRRLEAMRDRIIPALAGNTHRPRVAVEGRADHPRSRGEYRLRWVS